MLVYFVRGFAVVFAEDVPDVPSQVRPTGMLQTYSDRARDGSPKCVLSFSRLGFTLPDV